MFDYRNGVTIPEAAKQCGVSPRTVKKWWDGGALVGVRGPGKVIYLDPESVAEYYNKNKATINKFSKAYKRARKGG